MHSNKSAINQSFIPHVQPFFPLVIIMVPIDIDPQVKAQLADKAFRAAKAAEAVLIGKIALVEQLGEETKETQSVVREGSLGYQRAQENVAASNKAARDAHQQVFITDKKLRFPQSIKHLFQV